MYYHKYYDACQFKLDSLEFNVLSSETIKKLSVVKVHTSITFDALGHALPNGLYDGKLGPTKLYDDLCLTCGNGLLKCTGHYGHIELPVPIINPLFTAIVVNILKISCLQCNTIQIPAADKYVLGAQLRLIDGGYINEAQELEYYLEENQKSSLTADEIKEQMNKYCDGILNGSVRNKQCKSTDSLRKYYINVLFRKGSAHKSCINCNSLIGKITFQQQKVIIARRTSSQRKAHIERTKLTPLTIKEHMRELWNNDKDTLNVLIPALNRSDDYTNPTDLCFMTDVLVTPSNTRPVNVINNRSVEHPKNTIYKMILQDCLQIRSIVSVTNLEDNKSALSKELLDVVANCKGNTNNEKLYTAWNSLQTSVNGLLDANLLRYSTNYSAQAVERAGLKQLIEKKAGILRQNMMGKRVNYFARTVITPDPLLDIDEIGVPEVFAKKLTYPVPVTYWNVTELRKIVFNGPKVHPGANIVENEDGIVTWISNSNENTRKGLAKTLLTPDQQDSQHPKVVHRHLMNGDLLLLNRQPTLHKPSVMAHRARILKNEKTFRLHYANCKAYNADFDGDEMNAHFVQSELSRTEAATLANVSNQYLVPRDGTPLSGLIQDHVIAGFRLTVRGKFFIRSEYHQLVNQALSALLDDIVLLPPAIRKPVALWSGKQVISTIIVNLTPENKYPLNLESQSKISLKAWSSAGNKDTIDKNLSETNVIIRGGELLCGVLDKNHVGATHYGLIHSFYELYGPKYSIELLGTFSKLFTYYLQKDAFTLGVRDILIRRRADSKRAKIIQNTKTAGHTVASKALGLEYENENLNTNQLKNALEVAYKKCPNFRTFIDRQYKLILDKYTDEINSVCLPNGLQEKFPRNNLQLMVQSGAKGSTVNTMQISCLLGQIELEGKRPPLMISGRSLPSFPPYDTSPEAGGFITSRFMTGLDPREFFFHCMAGREGLIDTAVKTSRSGYLQRCLIKHLEGLVVNYDLTVRDSDKSVIQFLYGEDGQDITKSQLLKTSQFPFIVNNIESVHDREQIKRLTNAEEDNERILERKSAIKNSRRSSKNNKNSDKKNSNKAFIQFCNDVTSDQPEKTASELRDLWLSLDEETKAGYNALVEKCPDPVVADFYPTTYFGSISEKMEDEISRYLKENKIPIKKSKFRDAIYFKSMLSLCHPGEAVGILAAQSVGEPSTQMTLNTFHFAGRGEMNVTLGIPRLREILMVAAKQIKTPSMEIPFKENVPNLEKKAEKLRKNLNILLLKDVLETITVKESVKLKSFQRVYTLNMKFLPRSLYKNTTNLKPTNIIEYVKSKFLNKLKLMFKKHAKQNYGVDLVVQKNKEKKKKSTSDDEENEESYQKNDEAPNINSDDDSDTETDGDATESKFKSRKSAGNDYDEEDDDIGNPDTKLESDDEFENFLSCGSDSGIGADNVKNSDEDNIEKELIYRKENVDEDGDDCSEIVEIKSFKYDSKNFSYCTIVVCISLEYKRLDLSSLLPSLAANSVIHEVPGIKRAITYENNGRLILKTEGTYGISKLYRYENLLDLNKLYSNDIHAIASTYGIEAANRVISKEVQDVFQVYGINVDPRHLSLIADYMTFDGTYKPLNRTGMDGCPSPLQQMTFESTLKYLRNATISNLTDSIQSPSSCLMVGQEPKVGSGLTRLYFE